MGRVKSKWLLLGFLLLAVALIWSGYRYFFPFSRPASQKAQQAVKASLQDIELIHGQQGKPVWRLRASSSHMSREGKTIYFKEPRLQYYMENGSEVVRVAAAQGSLDQKDGRAAFWPEVVTNYRDMELMAGRMAYTAEQKQLHFSRGVEAKSPGMEILSQEAVFALPKQEFVFQGQAKVRLHETEKES